MTIDEAIEELCLDGVKTKRDGDAIRIKIPGQKAAAWSPEQFSGFCEFYFGDEDPVLI